MGGARGPDEAAPSVNEEGRRLRGRPEAEVYAVAAEAVGGERQVDRAGGGGG